MSNNSSTPVVPVAPTSLFNVTQDQGKTVSRLAHKLTALEDRFNWFFPEREWFVRQLIYAALTRGSVMVWGKPGTAKTMIARAFFSSFSGHGVNGVPAKIFELQLDQDTTKSDVIGGLDLQQMQQKVWTRFVEGYLPDADFALLDEVFSGAGLAEGLNDLLNEKRLLEGRLNISVPLHTGVATTNWSPEEVELRMPFFNLRAFNDRWLYVCEVGALKEEANQLRILLHHITSTTMPIRVNFSDIQQLAMIISETNQFPDEAYMLVYLRILNTFRNKAAKLGVEITDRKLTTLTQVVEAEAVRNGRVELAYEDLFAMQYGLCTGYNTPAQKLFMDIATPIIAEAVKVHEDKTDAGVKQHLQRIETEFAQIEKITNAINSAVSTKSALSTADALKVVEAIKSLRIEADKVTPTITSTAEAKKKLIKRLDASKEIINKYIWG